MLHDDDISRQLIREVLEDKRFNPKVYAIVFGVLSPLMVLASGFCLIARGKVLISIGMLFLAALFAFAFFMTRRYWVLCNTQIAALGGKQSPPRRSPLAHAVPVSAYVTPKEVPYAKMSPLARLEFVGDNYDVEGETCGVMRLRPGAQA